MSIPFYGLPGNPDFQYTHAVNIRYPKVGVRDYANYLNSEELTVGSLHSVSMHVLWKIKHLLSSQTHFIETRHSLNS